MARAKKRSNDVVAELRPIAKAFIKEALRVYDTAKDALAEAGEQFEDLVAEARAEMKEDKLSKPTKKQGKP
jgi:hypothetical protein